MEFGMPATSMKVHPRASGTAAAAPLLDIRDLTVGFNLPAGLKNVVHGLDLAVPRQGAIALVGESGSGKSVSMRSILGLLPGNARSSGSAMLAPDGQEPLDLRSEERRGGQ